EGKGTTVTLRLPLTIAIIEGFAFGVNDQTYVVPLDAVLECMELDSAPTDTEHGVLNLRGEPVPYVRLREALALAGAPPRRESVVVVKSGERRAGFVVDVLHGHSPTVVKPMGKLLNRLPGVSGTAIEGNGRVSLVLDVPHLMNTAARRAAKLAATAP
ncbi:MAG TPA: chemotaxis protein CheW, partial [Kofleriaceae bacterium]|nr:chemotaxis protein CheW [Kofleriaceae bacterium]